MFTNLTVSFVVVSMCFLAGCHGEKGSAQPTQPEVSKAEEQEIERLIDQLVDVSEPGFGYSLYISGSEFLPYEDTGEVGMAVLGASRARRSPVMRKIVEKGHDAVPSLVNHLDDERKVDMEPFRGMMWIDFSDEYDFNRRTRKGEPRGVNRDDFGESEKHPRCHSLTVGDLCFVALGQIVNRNFSATRYQPTGGMIINSPSYSKSLRKVIVDDWGGLSRQQHQESLVADFLKPDSPRRRIGAYWRLALYYPDVVEKLVLDVLESEPEDIHRQAYFIRHLTHDQSKKIGDVVKKQFLESANDDSFGPACLHCLASRGYGEFLIDQLGKVDVASRDVNYLHLEYIEAISCSQEQVVRDKLLEIVEATRNEAYFMAALPAVDRKHDELILRSARRLLAELPRDTDRGESLLKMIGQRFPDEANSIYRSFLAVDSPKRAETMCGVLWYGNPMSKELLAPLLDDKRSLSGFAIPMRVCDRAAQAISHTSDKISFDSEWSHKRKDVQIERIKQYCKDSKETAE